MTDRADELAHAISARYYFSLTAFTRDEMDAAIATAIRAYAAEQLYERHLHAMHGSHPAQVAFGLTGRRRFESRAEIQEIIRAAVARGVADAG